MDLEFEWDISKDADALNGVNFGVYIKQPKLSDLRIDVKGTKAMKEKMAKTKKIKITINIDEDVLESVRNNADQSGIPYQSLINRLLRHAVEKASENNSRLEKLGREVQALKKRVSA